MYKHLALFAAALTVLLASSSPIAQAQSLRGEAHTVAAPGREVSTGDARLIDEEELSLEAPDASEYALPILGTVVGSGAVLVGGFVFVFGAAFAASTSDLGADASRVSTMLVVSGLGTLAGGVMLGMSIAELVSLDRRRRGAEDAGITSAYLAPSSDGLSVGVAGTF